MTKIFVPKNPPVFFCKNCDYSTSSNKDFNKHLATQKHKYEDFTKNTKEFVPKNPQNEKTYKCECGKTYKHAGSLWNHKKKCNGTPVGLESNNLQELVIKLLIDNQEMKKENQQLIHTITDLVPKIGNNNNNNNNNNFNINVFLNEKCKDALTIDEFVEKIEISMKNLLTTKDRGLGEGLSNIIIDNMNKLSLYERPIHCTDKKRETIYIKSGISPHPPQWEKDEGNEKVNNFIKKVEHKQVKNMDQWTDEYPNYMDNDQLQEEYINLVKGCTSSIDGCKDKVIRKVCDNIYICKE
jgi:hypothetical protein